MAIGPERSADGRFTNPERASVPEALLASFIRRQPVRPSLEEISVQGNAHGLFTMAFERATAVDLIFNDIQIAIEGSNGHFFDGMIFNRIQRDVRNQMQLDPVNILAEEYWRRRHETHGDEIMPLVQPCEDTFWPQPSEWVTRAREDLDEVHYEQVYARLLRILKGTRSHYPLTREHIETLASPLLFSIPGALAYLEQQLRENNSEWEVIVLPGEKKNDDVLFLARKDREKDETPTIEKPKVNITIEKNMRHVYINGKRIALSLGPGRPAKNIGIRYSQRDLETLILLDFLQRHQGEMFETEDIIDLFTAAMGEGTDKYYVNRISDVMNIIRNHIKVGRAPLVTIDKVRSANSKNYIRKVGITKFDVTMEYELFSTVLEKEGKSE